MKRIITVLCLTLLTAAVRAEFRTWTRKDGKTAELELLSVSGRDGAKSGEFKMRSGAKVTLRSADLSGEDAKIVEEWVPEEVAVPGGESVFDDVLDGNLVRLKGRSLKRCKDATKPEKYYVFYYTASWCGPCQKFTPELVKFYNEHKNGKFEVVLITSDSDEDAMEGYAVNKQMPWPLLKLRKAKDFKKTFDHGVTGIPSVIVCELDGKVLGNYRNLAQLEKLVN